MGQIASFIDSLHLTYDEVVYKIPYRNLLVMQKDRAHEAVGEVVHYLTGAELAQRHNTK